jgi:hypothetical protein
MPEGSKVGSEGLMVINNSILDFNIFCDVTQGDLLRWRRHSGDAYNLGAQFVNNYRRVIKLMNNEFNVGSIEQCVQQLKRDLCLELLIY